MSKVKSTHIVICRSAFCLTCWQNGRPRKNDKFLVFGSDSQIFKGKKNHQDGIKGFVPHLFTIEFPYLQTEDGLIILTKTCLMDKCGITIEKPRDDGYFDFVIENPEEIFLPIRDVEALISIWRGSGYELI